MTEKESTVELLTKTNNELSVRCSFKSLPFKVVLTFIFDQENRPIFRFVDIKKAEGKKYRPNTESQILYDLKKALNILVTEQYQLFGFNEPLAPFIKKRMWKDGHMVSDHCQYLRTSGKPKKNIPFWGVYDSYYALSFTTERLKTYGQVVFDVVELKEEI